MNNGNSGIKLYIGGQFENRHEVEQFNNILSIIEENKNNLGDFVVIFGNVFIEGEEIDALIFKENAVIVIEMKSWAGKIEGNENGKWKVNGEETKNAFRQCRRKRYALFALLNKMYEDIKFDVSSWVVCDYNADCSNVECSEKDKKWFRAISLDELSSELITQRSTNTIRSVRKVEKIAAKLHLQESNFSDWMKIAPDKQYENVRYLFPKKKGEYEEYVIEKNYSKEYVIKYPPTDRKDLIVVCFIRNKITGKEYLSTALRLPLKIWGEIENYILKVEYSWSDLGRIDINMQEEGFSVRVGPLIVHKREGVQVEILKDGESLPSPKRVWFNMRSIEKLQDIILERRNE